MNPHENGTAINARKANNTSLLMLEGIAGRELSSEMDLVLNVISIISVVKNKIAIRILCWIIEKMK
jgi:hypothetical protein